MGEFLRVRKTCFLLSTKLSSITSTKIVERPSDSTMPAPLIDLGPVPLELPPQKERTSPARSLLQVESETMPNLKITVNLDMCEDKLQRLSSTIPWPSSSSSSFFLC